MEEPIGLMAGVPAKIEPHIPFYLIGGNTVVRYWETDFVDRVGNAAVLTHVEYKDKKGKIHECIIRVKWSK